MKKIYIVNKVSEFSSSSGFDSDEERDEDTPLISFEIVEVEVE